MALSGSSPCGVTRYLSGSSQPLPGPILQSCSPELGWKLRPPSPEDVTLRKGSAAWFWNIYTLPPVGSSPADARCRQMLVGTSPVREAPLVCFSVTMSAHQCHALVLDTCSCTPSLHMMHGRCSETRGSMHQGSQEVACSMPPTPGLRMSLQDEMGRRGWRLLLCARAETRLTRAVEPDRWNPVLCPNRP